MSHDPTRHLGDLVRDLQRTDPGRPRITWYVADGGPADGERVELSGAVLAMWASKAAGLLQDELDAGPGSVVLLDLPPHWRTLYWAIAAWAVGATVATRGDETVADVVVTADPAQAPDAEAMVVVTLPALARAAAVPVPAGAVDEARELATFPDVFTAAARAADADLALLAPSLRFAAPGPSVAATRRPDVVRPDSAPGPWLDAAASTLCAGGSLVTVRIAQDADPEATPRVTSIFAQEKIDGGARVD